MRSKFNSMGRGQLAAHSFLVWFKELMIFYIIQLHLKRDIIVIQWWLELILTSIIWNIRYFCIHSIFNGNETPFSKVWVLITLFLSIVLCSFAALHCTSFCAQVGEQVYAHAEWLYSLIKHIIPQLKERFSLLFFMLRWRTFLPYWF